MCNRTVSTSVLIKALGLNRNAFFEQRRHDDNFPVAVKGEGAGRYLPDDAIHYAQSYWLDKAADYQALADEARRQAVNVPDVITTGLEAE